MFDSIANKTKDRLMFAICLILISRPIFFFRSNSKNTETKICFWNRTNVLIAERKYVTRRHCRRQKRSIIVDVIICSFRSIWFVFVVAVAFVIKFMLFFALNFQLQHFYWMTRRRCLWEMNISECIFEKSKKKNHCTKKPQRIKIAWMNIFHVP